MDLKHKGISWVGNMFQKFEAVCQEVENIINQDKVKYVENQVSSANENVKKLYSDAVQGLLPLSPVKNEAKAAAQRRRVPVNSYLKSPSYSEGNTANDVVNNSSVGHGITDQIGNRSRASCKVTSVNEEVAQVAQVPHHSSLELNADLPLGKNDDVFLDKDLYENMKENSVNELLSEKSDGTLTDKPAFMESDASGPLCHSVRNVSSEIDDTNKRASSVCDDSDLQLEDDILLTDKDPSKSSEEDTTVKFNASDPLDHMANRTSCQVKVTNGEATLIFDNSHLPLESSRVSGKDDDTNKIASSVSDDSDLQLEDDILLVGNNDGVLTDKDASRSFEEDTTMEFNASDPLKHMANRTSRQVKVTSGEATLVLDNSHLPLESSRLSGKNDDDLSNEYSDEFLKKVVIMEPNAPDHLHDSHVWSGTNFGSKEADDSNLLLKCEVLTGRIDHALIDNDFDNCPIKDAIFEDDPNSFLLNLPSHGNGVSFTYEEAITVSDRNYMQLDPELLARKNEYALTDKYSNESLKKNTILELEHDASYPFKNQPSCTSSNITYKNEEVSSVSNDSLLKLESEVFCGKNSEALIDKASDASCKEQSNLKLSNELTLHCDEESIKETLCNCDNECEEDNVTSTGNLEETSIHGVDVESTHKVGQDSRILVNNSVGLSLRMETTSKYLENGSGCSSNASDAISSELASLVLTSRETVDESKPVSTLKSLPKPLFSASRSLVKNFSSSTVVVHDKPSDQRASINCESHSSFEVATSASYGNKALEMNFASSRSSLSSVESLGTHASRANESAFLPKFRTSSQVEFSKSTSSGALSFSTEVGFPYNSSSYITDAKMETVDLGHKVTLKDECDVVDYKALHAVSRRTQKLQSYKRRIQDAFTSKKRLAKEYEQLAIWYGDTDMEFSTDSSQKLDTKNVSTSYASDSEWEFL